MSPSRARRFSSMFESAFVSGRLATAVVVTLVLVPAFASTAWGQTPDGGAPDGRPPSTATADGGAPPAPAVAPVGGNLQVVKVTFRGNRKVEDDALRVNLRTVPGASLTQEMVREDVRALWRMGFFEDIQAEATNVPGGVA
ncbi:MAG TPA: POTRA domain-containing protein, partial [Polyangia bacterium]